MRSRNVDVSRRVVRQLLPKHNYVKRKSQKKALGISKNRNEQFENIAKIKTSFEKKGYPVISVDTKKKETIGKYSRSGDSLYGKEAQTTLDHDFKTKDSQTAVPHGIYDVKENTGYITIGKSSDTSEFVCDNIKNHYCPTKTTK